MDPVRFDALARVLSVPDSRRRMLGLLTAVPVVGGLLGILTPEETEAAGRRKRRKKAHKHGRGRRRKHRNRKRKPKCFPTTCRGGQICQSDGACCQPDTADLQAAITGAASGATIPLCAGTWTVGSTVVIDKDLTLIGAGAGQTVLDGGNAVRVLQVASGAMVTVQDLTITKGNAAGGDFFDRTGGGIFNEGMLRLVGTQVTENTADYGGGIFNDGGGAVTLQTGSRVSGNEATGGGGIFNLSGTVTLDSGAIICSNTPLDGQCAGTISGAGSCPNPGDGICPF